LTLYLLSTLHQQQPIIFQHSISLNYFFNHPWSSPPEKSFPLHRRTRLFHLSLSFTLDSFFSSLSHHALSPTKPSFQMSLFEPFPAFNDNATQVQVQPGQSINNCIKNVAHRSIVFLLGNMRRRSSSTNRSSCKVQNTVTSRVVH
jgi:hypothetical protein